MKNVFLNYSLDSEEGRQQEVDSKFDKPIENAEKEKANKKKSFVIFFRKTKVNTSRLSIISALIALSNPDCSGAQCWHNEMPIDFQLSESNTSSPFSMVSTGNTFAHNPFGPYFPHSAPF